MALIPRPCRNRGCPNGTTDPSGYCPDCIAALVTDGHRGTATRRGYDRKWRRYRAAYLSAHPLCARCARLGMVTVATVVDHIIPHRGDPILFWLPSNHQPLCKVCHDRKTAMGE